MSLDVLTQSTDRDLTTTSALKAMVLGATATSTSQDAVLSRAIRQASRWAETYLGYHPTLQSYEECVASFGQRRLMLSRTPLVAVTGVFDATDTGSASEVLSTEYRVQDREAGFLSRDQGFAWTATLQAKSGAGYGGWSGSGGSAFPLQPEPVPGDEYEPWLVRYRAGWTYGGVDTGSSNWSTAHGTTSTARTLPEDIEAGVLLRAQYIYENFDADGIAAESLGDLSVTYRSGNFQSHGEDEPYEKWLRPYRRFV